MLSQPAMCPWEALHARVAALEMRDGNKYTAAINQAAARAEEMARAESQSSNGAHIDALVRRLDLFDTQLENLWAVVRPSGRLVTGGPPPKPGERTEADYLREEVRELRVMVNRRLSELAEVHSTQMDGVWMEIKALRAKLADQENRIRDLEMDCEILPGMNAHQAAQQADAAPPAQEEAAPSLLKVPCGMCTHEVKTLRAEVGKKDREIAALERRLADAKRPAATSEQVIGALRTLLKRDAAATKNADGEIEHEFCSRVVCNALAMIDREKAKVAAKEADVAYLEARAKEVIRERDAARAALKAEQAAHAETRGFLDRRRSDDGEITRLTERMCDENVVDAVRRVCEGVAEARAQALEDAAGAAECALDPVTAFRLKKIRALGTDDENAASQRTLCAAAIRALAPAQKGGEDA